MVILNASKDSQKLNLDRYQEGLNGSRSGRDILSERTFNFENTLSIDAQSSMVIDLE
jgi:hypothetical protein